MSLERRLLEQARVPVSLPHEVVLEMLRVDGELARLMIGKDLARPPWKPESASSQFIQYPTERRADHVMLFRDTKRRPRLAVIIEMQRKIDHDKRRAWPSYLVEARNRYKCPTCLVVIAFRPHIAKWAGASIKLGHPGFILTPIVISKDHIPRIRTAHEARLNPELAVVSAIAHRDLETAKAAFQALRVFPRDMQRVYWNAILAEQPPTHRSILEKKHMMTLDWPALPGGPFEKQYKAIQRAIAGAQVVLAIAEVRIGKVSRKTAAAVERLGMNEKKLRALAIRVTRAQTAKEVKDLLRKVTRENPPPDPKLRPPFRIRLV